MKIRNLQHTGGSLFQLSNLHGFLFIIIELFFGYFELMF